MRSAASLLVLLCAPSVFTFTSRSSSPRQQQQQQQQYPRARSLTGPFAWELCAAARKKSSGKSSKRKQEAPSGGGFAASPKTFEANKAIVKDDYAVFPALELAVSETLVPPFNDASLHASSELPSEMYQRLDQIYGFPRFNYPNNNNNNNDDDNSQGVLEEEGTMSFTDLLSDTSSESQAMDGLLDSPSTSVTTSTTTTATTPGLPLPLSDLPPFTKFRVLHVDPLVLSIDEFFTEKECDCYVDMSASDKKQVLQSRSPTVGKDALAKAQRTSTTWYHHYKGVPELMSKASRLLGIDGIDQWEEPQTVRYRRNEKFTWHLDALGPNESKKDLGGQRTATLLVYLSDLKEEEGGATMFRDLGGSSGPLRVQPRKGSALLFFPAAGGIPNAPFDIRTLHCGEAVAEDSNQDKWISQLWLRQGPYTPTAPVGNLHSEADKAISDYCTDFT